MYYNIYDASHNGTETKMVQDFVRSNAYQADFIPSWTLVVTWYKVLPWTNDIGWGSTANRYYAQVCCSREFGSLLTDFL